MVGLLFDLSELASLEIQLNDPCLVGQTRPHIMLCAAGHDEFAVMLPQIADVSLDCSWAGCQQYG